MIQTPFLMIVGAEAEEFHLRAINLFQIAEVWLDWEEKTLKLKMSNDALYTFTAPGTIRDILELVSKMGVLPDGAPAGSYVRDVIDQIGK